MKKFVYLEHEISTEEVKPNPTKIKAINKMQLLVYISGLRRFLGLMSYYRRFVAKYAFIAEPLNNLLQKRKDL